MEKINFKTASNVLSKKEMKNILGGSVCCSYECGYPSFEGSINLDQDECWYKMERECSASFTIRPC